MNIGIDYELLQQYPEGMKVLINGLDAGGNKVDILTMMTDDFKESISCCDSILNSKHMLVWCYDIPGGCTKAETCRDAKYGLIICQNRINVEIPQIVIAKEFDKPCFPEPQ